MQWQKAGTIHYLEMFLGRPMQWQKAGTIHYLEMFLGRPMQWQICLLHRNELPFRALFTNYDGSTTGPNTFSGVLESQLKEQMASQEIVDFQPISSPHFPYLPEEVVEDLSWDQHLLYRFVQAIIIGEWDDGHAMLESGTLCHSRWLTLAQRIVCLYVRITRPSFVLRRLTTAVMKF